MNDRPWQPPIPEPPPRASLQVSIALMPGPSLRQEPPVPALSDWGRSNLLWLAVGLASLVLLGAAAWLVISDEEQPLPPFLQAGGVRPSTAAIPHDELRLAGSGSNLPITEALSTGLPRARSVRAVVHASVGSGGGIKALRDGVIDIALVSRPLSEGEREQGLVATPYARVPVVVAVHTSVPDDAITSAELVAIYEGSQRTWSNGTRVAVLQRERGDSSHMAFDRLVPGFRETNESAYQESRWRVLYRDDSMREALADTRGAIGLFGQGAIPPSLPIEALAVDGVHPSPETVRDGSYPFYKDFAFVTRGSPEGDAATFIAFALSEDGRRIIEEGGALPLPGSAASRQEDP